MNATEAYCHVPGLQLADAVPVGIHDWRLETLTGDQWFALEDAHCRELVGLVDAARPVFLVGRATFDGDLEKHAELQAQDARHIARCIAVALFFRETVLLPDVDHSAVYSVITLDVDGSATQIFSRRFGLHERESLINQRGREFVTTPEVAAAIAKSAWRVRHVIDAGFHQIRVLYSAFALTKHPACSLLNSIQHSVVAMENFVNPHGRDSLTRVFAERMAAMVSRSSDDIESWRELFKTLYGIRSSLAHGHFPKAEIRKLDKLDRNIVADLMQTGRAACSLAASVLSSGDAESTDALAAGWEVWCVDAPVREQLGKSWVDMWT